MATDIPAERVLNDLRFALVSRRMSMSKAAKAAGMSASALSRRFSGEVSPTIHEVSAIARAADLTMTIAFAPAESVVAA